MPIRLQIVAPFFIFYSFCAIIVQAQKSKLQIQLSSDRLQMTDKLDMVANYKIGDKELPPATLAVVLKENNGDGIWQLRWPMVDGNAQGSLLFPPNIKKGNYTLYFAVEPRFFQVAGQILFPPGIKKIYATIYSPTINTKNFEILIDEHGKFKMKQYLFQNSATLVLQIEKSKKMPAIHVDVMLDSVFEPAAFGAKEITIGMDEHTLMENKMVDNWKVYFDPFYKTTILGNMSAAQKFDSVYVSALYKKNSIESFDCLGDSELVKSKSLEAFFAKHYKGFSIEEGYSPLQVPTAHARGYDFTFYLNEKITSYWELGNIKLSDIAAIKLLPTFVRPIDPLQKVKYILALYTKHGPFAKPDYYRYIYTINGFQPPVYQLPPSPKMFASDPYNLTSKFEYLKSL